MYAECLASDRLSYASSAAATAASFASGAGHSCSNDCQLCLECQCRLRLWRVAGSQTQQYGSTVWHPGQSR